MAKNKIAKNTICLWYDKDAEAAARFYAQTFPDSTVGAIHRAPSDNPSTKAGDVLVVEFTVAGVACIGLNGGPAFKHNEAFSFQIATDDQAETDRYWNAIVGNGGQASDCGWCKDKWGVSWQITPRVLTEALAAGGAEAKRAFDAMMTMQKIDVTAIEAARQRRAGYEGEGMRKSRKLSDGSTGNLPRPFDRSHSACRCRPGS
jgi:predicted 3-demethylubiquinone-9 3-methyltransferase (glyoxalase superfamily)